MTGFRTWWWTALLLLMPLFSLSQEDSTAAELPQNGLRRFNHQVGVAMRMAPVFPTGSFFDGVAQRGLSVKRMVSGHFTYSFAFPEGSLGNRVFSGAHQGIGLSYYDFGNRAELGNPVAAYMFQQAKIAELGRYTSLHYEWNFGISAGWNPYDDVHNPNNIVIGSRVNAYLNLGVYVKRKLSARWSLAGGVDATHFSNGNTEFPNAGLNAVGVKAGVSYGLLPVGRGFSDATIDAGIPEFPKHISYDVVIFGAWKRKGVEFFGKQVASPYKYPVLGGYFAPMYNFGYHLRAGASVDVIYDGSANVYTADYIVGTEQQFFKPNTLRQVALGASIRADYVMPIFTLGLGLGANVIHKGGDMRGTYQAVTLKVRTTKESFIHIGYSLKDFREPNYLMLGLGYRFSSRAPSLLVN